MSPEIWKQNLYHFLAPHPAWHDSGEEVYVPRDGISVAFFFDGGLRVAGDSVSLEVNYNNPDLLILGVKADDSDRIYRVPWSRLVCFELIRMHPPQTGSLGAPPMPS